MIGLVQGMGVVQRVVGLGRAARNVHNLKTRQPLASVTLVASRDAERDFRPHLERFADLIQDELNVKLIRWAEDRTEFVRHEVKPNFRALGKRLGPLMPKVKAALEAADGDRLVEALEEKGSIELTIAGEDKHVHLDRGDLEVRLIEKEGLATAGDRELLVALDTAITPDLRAEGWAREVVNRIQTARKDADLDYADRIRVRYRAAEELEAAIAAHRGWIAGETLAVELEPADGTATGAGAPLTSAAIDEHDFAFAIERVERPPT
jgi:isoleucyl-tRNA synthetase